jgi:hypothetical protein
MRTTNIGKSEYGLLKDFDNIQGELKKSFMGPQGM